ncbi:MULTISPECIES: type II toxin-antitoxin system RatA family toxin [Gammaproteobacteria]|uniref:type II toxin-antitoxin system RatA family toxin n=1 Tax=Gammaproteobacteria TaxID=1236 RepID=UPI000DD066FE|nr:MULTISPECIES: type II toxin-antitoxin system RatA family toxin [Gammaproteobacteria]RTE87397.1 type II toxin-antitoxin system RatA family toxin [Aliidiomarina sp. B3213]TCZ92817.1 type II toxin-antitoxin system RatA family toxin [Lysobacter sp. N42]
MPQVERSALVHYSCEQMFDLVNDITAYPEFVPGCVGARLLSSNDVHGNQVIEAELSISKAGIQQTFATRNTLHPHHTVDMQLLNGPFKSLQGGWKFEPLSDDACKVILQLDFEFSSKLLHFAFAKVFNEVTSRMVDAFAKRAKQVYGSGGTR